MCVVYQYSIRFPCWLQLLVLHLFLTQPPFPSLPLTVPLAFAIPLSATVHLLQDEEWSVYTVDNYFIPDTVIILQKKQMIENTTCLNMDITKTLGRTIESVPDPWLQTEMSHTSLLSWFSWATLWACETRMSLVDREPVIKFRAYPSLWISTKVRQSTLDK